MTYCEDLEKRNEELESRLQEFEKFFDTMHGNVIHAERTIVGQPLHPTKGMIDVVVIDVRFVFNEELYKYFQEMLYKNDRFI